MMRSCAVQDEAAHLAAKARRPRGTQGARFGLARCCAGRSLGSPARAQRPRRSCPRRCPRRCGRCLRPRSGWLPRCSAKPISSRPQRSLLMVPRRRGHSCWRLSSRMAKPGTHLTSALPPALSRQYSSPMAVPSWKRFGPRSLVPATTTARPLQLPPSTRTTLRLGQPCGRGIAPSPRAVRRDLRGLRRSPPFPTLSAPAESGPSWATAPARARLS
mmetsp:Transcript_47080/g.131303  ORF Transcript_47080/g.131303 Transcript_47080/m.131303 type:complete len:216 (+) Transcript_47080:379-1026(+)